MFRHAYKLPLGLTAQNAGVAQTCVGVAYLSFITNEKTGTCALYVDHRHICAWPKNPNICISLFCNGQTLIPDKYDPGHYETMKYRRCAFPGVHKYAFGAL